LLAYSIIAHAKECCPMTIVADTSATLIPTGTWSIDPVWSALEFEIEKLGLVTVKGRIPGFAGTIQGGVAVDRRKGRRVNDHDLRRDPGRARPGTRLLRHRPIPGAPLRVDGGRDQR